MEKIAPRRTANRQRLGLLLQMARSIRPADFILTTFFAKHRTDESHKPIGCLLGHYALYGNSRHLTLQPITFHRQLKSLIFASETHVMLPDKDWQHYTLHYLSKDAEAWGATAAMLYFQIGVWDANRLFWPHGNEPLAGQPLAGIVKRLERFLQTTEVPSAESMDLPDRSQP